jgi:hypothetical protein
MPALIITCGPSATSEHSADFNFAAEIRIRRS